MSEEGKHHILIPALIAAAAAYFGCRKKSENLGEIAKTMVNMAVKDQVRQNNKDRQLKNGSQPLRLTYKKRSKRNNRDVYYG